MIYTVLKMLTGDLAMTHEEMIKRINEGDRSEELVNALIDFKWDFDPYGVMDAYGHIDDEGVREQMADEVNYLLENEPALLIDEIKFDMEG